jgi:hypothetical protein
MDSYKLVRSRRRRLRGTAPWSAGSGIGVRLATICGMHFEIKRNVLVGRLG